MATKDRALTVLCEFRPLGLSVEAADGDGGPATEEPYYYFLFDPSVSGDRSASTTCDLDFSHRSYTPSDAGDHEIFVRGNRIIWSTGSRVHKRYISSSTVIMACWCRMGDDLDAVLCVLQANTLSMFYVSGEHVNIPLPHAVASIWPVPFGLLLQKAGGHMISSSNALQDTIDIFPLKKEHDLGRHSPLQLNSFKETSTNNGAIPSSHVFLRHHLEEPQSTYIEESGVLSMMSDFDEITIWTSDLMPLMVSYNQGKSQHSIWQIDISDCQDAPSQTYSITVPFDVSSCKLIFRKIWQGKCSLSAASKVFLATDIEGIPAVCFLLDEEKLLLAIRIQVDDNSYGVLSDNKLMSWNVPAIAAAPVVVTRPSVRDGVIPFTDILVLSLENDLLLYSGSQCLCRYTLSTVLEKGIALQSSLDSAISELCLGIKITGIADAVEGRVNVICNNGLILRCLLRRSPSSTLVSDCITALADGLHVNYYSHFIGLLWGSNDSSYLSCCGPLEDSEWQSFSAEITKLCMKYSMTLSHGKSVPSNTAWDFLLSSKFHSLYDYSSLCFKKLPSKSPLAANIAASSVGDGPNSQALSFYIQLMRGILDSLHALYENLKINILRKKDVRYLASLLCRIASSLGETAYVDHYCRDFPCMISEFDVMTSESPSQTPPCLFRWLQSCLQRGSDFACFSDIPSLIRKEKCSAVSWARKVVSFYSLLFGAKREGRQLSSGVCCDIATGSTRNAEELVVLAMIAEKFGHQQLDLLPVGVSLPIRHALEKCRESPPVDWPASAYVLVGREDLAIARLNCVSKDRDAQNFLSLTSMMVPYMLRLQPVNVPLSALEITKSEVLNSEPVGLPYKSVDDGMEHIFNSNTQLRYGRDLRLIEVGRLLCSSRPVAIQTPVNPSASDQDLQQHQLWNLAQRTAALPFGRGAFTLGTTCTLLTEALAVPKFVLAGRLPAQQNATVNIDQNIRNISEFKSWAEFHNGVAAGLRLAPFQGKMSRTWIEYNKPAEPNFTHAGLLLALGLHEHLRVLIMPDVYRYLSQEHDITTMGLLLGMAASHRGTMDPAISKMLYFHVPSRQPSSCELELPTILQTAAVMGIGLLYEASAHSVTMKTLLDEIGRRSSGDNVLEREGYAVAAGAALGLVALGKGSEAFGFMDTFQDRLLQYIGNRKVYDGKFLSLNVSAEEQIRRFGQVMDGAQINVDVTAPGALIAFALIFLKTESEEMAAYLDIPSNHFDLQYVRPDFIMLRVIARNLIIWSRIKASRDWIESQVPQVISVGITQVRDEAIGTDVYGAEALFQAYVNIVTGACIALGLKYAGTKYDDAQEVLHSYATYFLNEIKHISIQGSNLSPKGLLQFVNRGTLELCLHLIVLSLCLVMAGSGHLRTFRLLRYLRGRSSAEGQINYGFQMAVSMATGFLFLGGGYQSFSTSNSAVATLLITLYPRFPSGPSDNRCHLQTFRHFYAFAAESRCVQTVDADTGLPVYCPLEIITNETECHCETNYTEVTPCILPERSMLKSIQVCGPRYWPQFIQLEPADKAWWRVGDKDNPFKDGIIYVKRRVGSCTYADDPMGCQSLLSRAMLEVNDTSPIACTSYDSKVGKCLFRIDQLVGAFSANPSLKAFAKLCGDFSSKFRCDTHFQEFCSQILYECICKDMPALLQVYMSLYIDVDALAALMKATTSDAISASNLKVALAYVDALVDGRLGNSDGGGLFQTIFLESIRKRIADIFARSENLQDDFVNYARKGIWPCVEDGNGANALLLSWYLQWYDIPSPNVLASALQKIGRTGPGRPSMVPLLHFLLPTTHHQGIVVIDRLRTSMEFE